MLDSFFTDMYVPTSVIVMAVISAVVNTIGWIILLIVFNKKMETKFTVSLIGMLAFFVSQTVIRMPLLSVLQMTMPKFMAFTSSPLGMVLIGGLTAGLFEETARLICVSIMKPENRHFKNSVSFGLGHGVFEAVTLVGFSMISNLIVMIMINSGAFSEILKTMSPIDRMTITPTLMALCGAKPYTFILGILERASSITFHVFASYLIFKGKREGKTIQYYITAVLLHTLSNSIIAIGNIFVIEGIFVVSAIIGIIYLVRKYKSEKISDSQ